MLAEHRQHGVEDVAVDRLGIGLPLGVDGLGVFNNRRVVAHDTEATQHAHTEFHALGVFARTSSDAQLGVERLEERPHLAGHGFLDGTVGDVVQIAQRTGDAVPDIGVLGRAHGVHELEVVDDVHLERTSGAPGVVEQVVLLDLAHRGLEHRQQLGQHLGLIADTEEPVAMSVDHDPLDTFADVIVMALLAEHQRLLDDAVASLGAQLERNRPERLFGAVFAQHLELILRQLDAAGQGRNTDGDQRMAGGEDPLVHQVAHRNLQTRSGSALIESVPEVVSDGVGQVMTLAVDAHARTEGFRPDELLQHAQHAATLLVGDQVEDLIDLEGVVDSHLDGVRAVQLVETKGTGARQSKRAPGLPLREHGVDAHVFEQSGKALVEPEVVPPVHGGIIAEAHVHQLVDDDVSDTLALILRGGGLVEAQVRHAVDDAAEVFHGAGSEVRDSHEVDFVIADVLGLAVVLQPGEGKRTDALSKLELVFHARDGPEAQLGAARHDAAAASQLADHEGQVVGGHLGGDSKLHSLEQAGLHHHHTAVGEFRGGFDRDGGFARRTHGRERLVAVRHVEGDLEGGLHVGLVEARERAASVGGLELRRGDDMLDALVVLPGAAVEALQLIVEDTGEVDLEAPLALAHLAGELDGSALQLIVVLGSAFQHGAVGVFDGDAAQAQILGVDQDLRAGLCDLDVDCHRTKEGQGDEVRSQLQIIVKRQHMAGQAELAAKHHFSSREVTAIAVAAVFVHAHSVLLLNSGLLEPVAGRRDACPVAKRNGGLRLESSVCGDCWCYKLAWSQSKLTCASLY